MPPVHERQGATAAAKSRFRARRSPPEGWANYSEGSIRATSAADKVRVSPPVSKPKVALSLASDQKTFLKLEVFTNTHSAASAGDDDPQYYSWYAAGC